MDSCVDQMSAPQDNPEMPRRDEKDLREIITLVQPLLSNRGKAAKVDIGREILVPAETCRWNEHYDLENLCEVFRVVLDQVGRTILSTLATYVSSFDPEDALLQFLGDFELLANRLISAQCTSIIDAFRIGFTDELHDEPF